jgi:xanthine dehydrogenase accessory factor
LRITPVEGEAESREEPAEAGLVVVANPCLSGGTLEIFLEPVLPPVLVHVFGESPVARALMSLGAALGFEVHQTGDPAAAIDADASAVVVASHGRYETEVLTAALTAGVPYIGLLASPRRGAAVVATLPADEAARACVRTPAGLDIGARSPAEIALSVLAEVIARRPRPAARTPAPAVAASTTAVDPVCGMSVAVSPATPQIEYAQSVWRFCGPGCLHAFADDPERYVDEHASS